jgi:hypothetical protein
VSLFTYFISALYRLVPCFVFNRDKIVSQHHHGGKVVSPTHPPHITPQKHYYFYIFGTHFCWRLSKSQDLVRPEGLGKFKKSPQHVSNP